MKLLTIAALSFSLACQILAVPLAESPSDVDLHNVPVALFEKRGLIQTINAPPAEEVTCGSGRTAYTYSIADISAALSQGVQWQAAQIQRGTGRYPHEFTNAQGWDYPNCAGATIYEFPVLKSFSGSNPWQPADQTVALPGGNPDRVLFTVQSADEGTYCGMLGHDKNAINPITGKAGAFVQCTP